MNQNPEFTDHTRVENESVTASDNLFRTGGNEPIVSIDKMPTGKEDDLFIGSGKIVGLIGKGGMAAVYKIWNKGLDKFHAIKIAFPDERQNYARFTTEAKIASKLKQTNIVEIKNVGEWKGLPFIEMEFIDGKTLRDLFDEKGNFPPSVACAVAIFIARALNHAHSETVIIDGKTHDGIIHRDLKPENIMVSKTGQITVTDLGLARPTKTSLHTTQVQAFIGTPQYAAPEQYGFEKADHRADIYALGEIIYEMVSGCKVFPDAAFMSVASDMEAVLAKCLELKRNKSYKLLKDFRNRIPSKIDRLVERCLEPDRKRRYQDSRALLKDLEDILGGLTEKSPEDVTRSYFSEDATKKESPSEKSGFFGIKVLLPAALFLIVTIGALVFLYNKKSPETKIVTTTSDASPQPTESGKTVIESNVEFTPLSGVRVKSDSTAPQRALPLSLPAIGPEKKTKKEKDRVQEVVAGVPSPVLDTAALLQKRYGVGDPVSIAEAAIAKKEYADAMRALSMVLPDHPKAAYKTVLLIEIYRNTGKFEDARDIIERTDISAAEYDLAVGKFYADKGMYQKAIQYFNLTQEKKCIMPDRRSSILAEALYLCARASQKLYNEDKSQQNLESARDAWNNVKKNLFNKIDDLRYKEAVEVLSKL